jgi:hypothetical protein
VILRLDLGTAPPAIALLDAEDFGSFKAQVVLGSHIWIAPDTLELLGPREREWKEHLDAMIAYAREHDWTDESGRVRVHIELVDRRDAQADEA